MADKPEGEPRPKPVPGPDEDLLTNDDIDRLFDPPSSDNPKPQRDTVEDPSVLTSDDIDALFADDASRSEASASAAAEPAAQSGLDTPDSAPEPDLVIPDSVRGKIMFLVPEVFGSEYMPANFKNDLKDPADFLVRLADGALGNADLISRLAPLIAQLPNDLIERAKSLAQERNNAAVHHFFDNSSEVAPAAPAAPAVDLVTSDIAEAQPVPTLSNDVQRAAYRLSGQLFGTEYKATDFDRELNTDPLGYMVHLVTTVIERNDHAEISKLNELIRIMPAEMQQATANLAEANGESAAATFIRKVAEPAAPTSPDTDLEHELAVRGFSVGQDVWLLPDLEELSEFVDQLIAGNRVNSPSCHKYQITGTVYDAFGNGVLLVDTNGSQLNLNFDNINSLVPIAAAGPRSFVFHKETCTSIGEINGYTLGIAPSGAIRYLPPTTSLDPEEDDPFASESASAPRPPAPRPLVHENNETLSALPRYFLNAIDFLLHDRDSYNQFVNANSEAERMQVIVDKLDLEDSSGEKVEINADVVSLLTKLTNDAAEHLQPGVSDRILAFCNRAREWWQSSRIFFLKDYVHKGGKAARYVKRLGLSAVSGATIGGVLTAIGAPAPLLIGSAGAVAAGVGHAAGNLEVAESAWMVPKVEEEERNQSIRNRVRQYLNNRSDDYEIKSTNSSDGIPVADISGEIQFIDKKTGQEHSYISGKKPPKIIRELVQLAISDVDTQYRRHDTEWIDALSDKELLTRLAEARLFFARREVSDNHGKYSNASGDEFDLYGKLIRRAIEKCGNTVVAATVMETDESSDNSSQEPNFPDMADQVLKKTTGGRQVALAAVKGMIAGIVSFGAGYTLSHFAIKGFREALGYEPAASNNHSHPDASSASGAPATSTPSVTTPESVPVPTGGGELHLNSADGYSASEVHSVAEAWVHPATGAETNLHEMQYAEHSVRASIASKLGLWADNGDGTGHLTGEWKTTSEWTDDSGVHHTVREMVNAPTSNSVNLAPVRLVDGQFDFSKLTIAPDNNIAAQINAGPWQTSWGDFRAAQLMTKLDDVTALANVTGYSVKTLQAHPDLVSHLREQAGVAIKAQLGAGPDGKTLPMPNIGGQILGRSSSSIDVLDGPLKGALHREAADWAQARGIQLIEPAQEITKAAVSGGGYQGLWGSRNVAPVSEPGEAGYRGWGDSSTAQREIPDMSRDAVLERTAPHLRQEGLIPPEAKPIEPAAAGTPPAEIAVPRPNTVVPATPTGQPLPPVEPKLPTSPAAPDLKPASIDSNPLGDGEQIGGEVRPVIDLKPTHLQPGETLGGSVTPTTP